MGVLNCERYLIMYFLYKIYLFFNFVYLEYEGYWSLRKGWVIKYNCFEEENDMGRVIFVRFN